MENEIIKINGLLNLGNTCYLNSILQCLFYTEKFNEYICDITILNNDIKSKILQQLKNINQQTQDYLNNAKNEIIKSIKETITYNLFKLFIEMKTGKNIRPTEIKKLIEIYNNIFLGYSQNDSHELLTILFEKIHEETKTDFTIKITNIPSNVIEYLEKKTV